MIATLDGLRARLAELRAQRSPRVALVSTLGALHDGHLDLIDAARRHGDVVVVSLFVNPLRFATAAEYDAYPRRPDDDRALLESLGVDVVFAPAAAELLPRGTATTRVSAGDAGRRLEGSTRPFYFDGVLTVEALLFNLVRPQVAVYGERDRQRIFLVQRMIRDLGYDIDLVAVPTVRADDGLPVSSRVPLLGARDLAAAQKLPAALEAAAANADRGVDACIAAAQAALMGESGIRLEYLSVVDPASFLPADDASTGRALALIAASVGGHRFIDSAEIHVGSEASGARR